MDSFFKCPECGGESLLEAIADATIYNKVVGLDGNGFPEYKKGPVDIQGGTLSGYRCGTCGYAVPGADDPETLFKALTAASCLAPHWKSWRDLIEEEMAERGETWDDLEAITFTGGHDANTKFNRNGYEFTDRPFTAWTGARTYFPVEGYCPYVDSVPRNPGVPRALRGRQENSKQQTEEGA